MKKLILLSLVLILTVAMSISVFQANAETMVTVSSDTVASHSIQGTSQLAYDFYQTPDRIPTLHRMEILNSPFLSIVIFDHCYKRVMII